MKITLTILCLASAVSLVTAQTGPGDVGTTDGLGSLILWLDASELDISDGNNVTVWTDLSGTGSDLSQSNVNAKPNLIENVINNKPAVRFNGDDEHLSGSHTLTAAPTTIFCVFSFDNISQTADNNDYVYSIGSTNSANRQLSLSRRRTDDVGNENKYYSWDGASARFGPVLDDQNYISTQRFDEAAPFHSVNINGLSALPTDYAAAPSTFTSDISLGEWTQFSTTNVELDGYIAEFILYNTKLNEVEIKIIENYLSEKYAIAITGDLYAGNLETDVTGVGTEADGSKSQASSAGISIEQVSGFEDGDYLLIGHETPTNTINTSDIADVSATLTARWDRYWYFDVLDASTAATVDIVFDHTDADFFNTIDGSAAEYNLLYRSTESGNWTQLMTASSLDGDQVTFENVAISSDGYYTLGTTFGGSQPFGLEKASFSAGTGPAGVDQSDGTGSLKLWFDASAMNAVENDLMVAWEDLSGYGHDATQGTFSKIPTFDETVAAINNRDAILFDESPGNTAGQFYDGTLTSAITTSTTLISVGYFGAVNQDDDDNDYFIGIGSGTNANETLSISRRRADEQPTPGGTDHPDEYYSWYGTDLPRYGPVITGQNWNIYYQTVDNSTNSHSLAIDGVAQTVTDYTGTLSTNTDFSIGKWPTNENNFLEGEVAEIIFFDKKLNSAEDTIMHNYLSAKYNLPLTSTKDIYAGDDALNGNYDDDVAGIGTEADGSNSIAVSAGMRISIGSAFANGEYLIVGHNTPTNTANGSDANLPDQIKERSNRDWYFDITALTNITVDILFDLSDLEVELPASDASNYVLIYRVDNSSDWSVEAVADSYANDQIFFNDITLSDDGYYTIGTLNNNDSPLPVELISLEAYQNDESIVVVWSTATEINNEEFRVMHSTDGSNFRNITSVEGNGTTVQQHDYQAIHASPSFGLNYYQLVQFDFDGASESSEVIAVVLEKDYSSLEKMILFPMPADEVFHMDGPPINSSQPKYIVLYDLQGRVHLEGSLTSNTIDTSELSNGMYILRIEDRLNSQQASTYKIIVNHN
ncbi:MAG: T9SS type A sorting domain-containing protein [Cyclobacteriaceae bacterium]